MTKILHAVPFLIWMLCAGLAAKSQRLPTDSAHLLNDSLLFLKFTKHVDKTYTLYLNTQGRDETLDNLSYLKEVTNALSEKKPSRDDLKFYSASFVQYDEALKKVDDALRSRDEKNSIGKLWIAERNIDFIRDDLEPKLNIANANGGNGSMLADLQIAEISVTVKVVDENGNDIAGCSVIAEPPIRTPSSQPIQFNPTNNATRNMRPGKYIFKVSKGTRKGERMETINSWLTQPIIIQL